MVDKIEKLVSEDLEQELNNWRHKHFHGRRDKDANGEYLERTSQLDLAQHFAKWQKEQDNVPVSEDLEKAAEEYDGSLYRSDCFKAGAKWKEKQMQGKTMHVDNNSEWEDIDKFMRQNVDGKCKIVIIKDE